MEKFDEGDIKAAMRRKYREAGEALEKGKELEAKAAEWTADTIRRWVEKQRE